MTHRYDKERVEKEDGRYMIFYFFDEERRERKEAQKEEVEET